MSIKEFTTDEALLSTPCEKATAEDAAVAQDLLDTLASLEGAACPPSLSDWYPKRKPRVALPMKSQPLTPVMKR